MEDSFVLREDDNYLYVVWDLAVADFDANDLKKWSLAQYIINKETRAVEKGTF